MFKHSELSPGSAPDGRARSLGWGGPLVPQNLPFSLLPNRLVFGGVLAEVTKSSPHVTPRGAFEESSLDLFMG